MILCNLQCVFHRGERYRVLGCKRCPAVFIFISFCSASTNTLAPWFKELRGGLDVDQLALRHLDVLRSSKPNSSPVCRSGRQPVCTETRLRWDYLSINTGPISTCKSVTVNQCLTINTSPIDTCQSTYQSTSVNQNLSVDTCPISTCQSTSIQESLVNQHLPRSTCQSTAVNQGLSINNC